MIDRYQSLVPTPRQATSSGGAFEFTVDTQLVAADSDSDIVRLLLAPLRLPLRPAGDATAANTITVRIDDTATDAEGYRLTVRADGVEIVAADLDGVRHGVSTLRQLLPDDSWRQIGRPGVRWEVPCGEVIDAPAMAWRGGMLDVARHFLPKRALMRYVDLFAMHRLNRLHVHLTEDQGWRIESRKYPEITEIATHRPATVVRHAGDSTDDDGTPHGGYYTLDDLAEVAAYGKERGVQIVPEVDLPGHASALLAARPELGIGSHQVLTTWGITAGVITPLPATVRFVTDILEELIDAIPGEFVHLGGDECVLRDWVTDPEVSAYLTAEKLEPAQAHGHFLRQIAEWLSGRDRRMLAWDEAFVTGGLRPDSIVTAWRGDKVARRAAAAGYDVVRSPVWPTYFDYYQESDEREPLGISGPIRLDDVAGFTPVPDNWSEDEAARIIGTQFQAWSEYIPHERSLDYMVFPRACALADVAWTGQPSDLTADSERLATHLGRLDAAGVEYRPLAGPHPWQEGGTGVRRFRAGPPIEKLRAHHDEIAESGVTEHASA